MANIDTEGLERYIRISNAIMEADGGFDLYQTEDGVHYQEILNDGFHDKYNYGCRSFIAGSDGLYLGTANPYYGGQLWKLNEITAELKTLSSPQLNLSFERNVKAYQATVDQNVTELSLTALGADPGTQVLVNGRESDGAAVTIALKNGENIIRIETTSIDGSVTDVYVLTVTRGAAASEPTEPDTAEPGEQSPSNPDASGTEGEAPTASTQKDATQAPTGPDNVDIPGTGSGASVAMLAVLVIGAAGTMTFSRKKRG